MKKKAIRIGAIVVVAMLCFSVVSSIAENTKETSLTATMMPKKAIINPTIVPTARITGFNGNVQVTTDLGDDRHPTLVKAPDDSLVLAYDRQIGPLEGHIYFMRSTDNGNTWTEIWNTDTGDMEEGVQEWPALCVPPGSDFIYGAWNDKGLDRIYIIKITDAADPATYAENVYFFSGDYDSEIHNFDITAIDENTWAFSYIGHVEYAGYDLPRSIETYLVTGGFEEGTYGWTGDQFYPLSENLDVTNTGNLFWYAWEYDNETSGTKDIGIHWGHPADETDIALWPVKEINSADHNLADPALGGSGSNFCLIYMSDDTTYGDYDFRCKYSTDEGTTWNDGTFPSQPQVDDKNPEIYMTGSNVFCTFIRNGNLYFTKSTDLGQTWEEPEQINEEDGSVVDEFQTVEVMSTGMTWTDNRNENKDIYFNSVPAPIINIDGISGGFGISATITNTGTVDAENVEWTITVDALIGGGEKTDTIETLPAGGEEPISTGFMLGLGPADITVTANGASATASGFMLGPFMLGVK